MFQVTNKIREHFTGLKISIFIFQIKIIVCKRRKQPPEPPEVFYKKRGSQNFCKIHRKTPVPESLF